MQIESKDKFLERLYLTRLGVCFCDNTKNREWKEWSHWQSTVCWYIFRCQTRFYRNDLDGAGFDIFDYAMEKTGNTMNLGLETALTFSQSTPNRSTHFGRTLCSSSSCLPSSQKAPKGGFLAIEGSVFLLETFAHISRIYLSIRFSLIWKHPDLGQDISRWK